MTGSCPYGTDPLANVIYYPQPYVQQLTCPTAGTDCCCLVLRVCYSRAPLSWASLLCCSLLWLVPLCLYGGTLMARLWHACGTLVARLWHAYNVCATLVRSCRRSATCEFIVAPFDTSCVPSVTCRPHVHVDVPDTHDGAHRQHGNFNANRLCAAGASKVAAWRGVCCVLLWRRSFHPW